MKTRSVLAAILWSGIGLSIWGCAGVTQPPALSVPATARPVADHIVYSSTTWSGDVRLVKPLIVTRTATLTLQPGTRIFFDLPEPEPNADREPWILVLGSLVALGSPEQPITFTSVQVRTNELDDMVQIQEAKEAHFRHCVFERGPWALHVHETPVDVLDCVFRNNFGGLRFQGGDIVLRDSRFEENRIGVRCLSAAPVIEGNSFVGNLTGIFFRQGVDGAVIRHNNFDNREYDIKLGEAQVHDVSAPDNWWAERQEGAVEDRIYDRADSPEIGRVIVASPLAEPWGTPP